MKAILIFFAVFLFINLLSIYIMGGFYCQTIGSKVMTEFFALCIGAIVALFYHFEVED
jgi:membrane associated rhomboid family serine protease